MAIVALTALNGHPLKFDPNAVRQVLGTHRAQVYLMSGLDVEVRETREQALEKITAPQAKHRK